LRVIDDWVRPNLERVFANARELRRQAGFPGPKESKEMDAALEVLVDACWISLQPGDGLGRSRKDFIVNPKIYKTR
jgi:hypothetical protein